MKNKGFTLIELLAVIVILAIIALIAAPIILNIIDESRKSANKSSIDMYAKAVENAIADYELNNKGQMPTDLNNLSIQYDGNEVECTTKGINSDGTIYLSGCSVNGTPVTYTYGTREYKNGDVVYFDIEEGTSCTDYNLENSEFMYNGLNGTGNQNSCLKFYAFNDDGSGKINLLLDHDLGGSGTAWNGSGEITDGPVDAISVIDYYTSDWNGTQTPTSYIYTNGSNITYTVDYTGYKARLITVEEIAKITGNTTFNTKTATYNDWFYLDTNTQVASETCTNTNTSGCKYYWLTVNNDYGYHTATTASDGSYPWDISEGSVAKLVATDFYDWSTPKAVRPVIEVLKENL